jgi:NAD(P)-dependent dehydrogenase (short-subunit alcohol dehydrogenase family)
LSGLDAKIALVTGAAQGIGFATAREFVQRGASVVLGDIQRPAVEAAADRLGSDALGVHFDVTDERSVAAAIDRTVELWGRLDVLVANAGIGLEAPTHDMQLLEWERVLAVNLTGMFLCAKHALRAMLDGGGGAIVCHASMSGQIATSDEVAYCASKAGVVGMVRSIAADYASRRIRCNAVCPGVTDTPMTAELWRAHGEDFRAEVTAQHPLGIGRPEDVARASAFLASDDAAHITGVTLFVDGGYTVI